MGYAVPHSLQTDNLAPRRAQGLTTLDRFFDTSAYLAQTSDVAALMTLEHQTRMTNLITRIGWDTRIVLADGKLEESRDQLDAEISEMVKQPTASVNRHALYQACTTSCVFISKPTNSACLGLRSRELIANSRQTNQETVVAIRENSRSHLAALPRSFPRQSHSLTRSAAMP